MGEHKETFCEFYGYKEGDFISDAITGEPAVDVHAICASGMGGNENMNRIENLIPLTRSHHEFYGGPVQYKAMLYKLVLVMLIRSGKDFDMEWLMGQILKYEN